MANKIIRSIRFSEDIYNLIEQQPGDSFTGKFESLVRRCVEEQQQKEQELTRIREQIARERQHLQRIKKEAQALDSSIQEMQSNLNWYGRQVKAAVEKLDRLIGDA